MKAKLFFPLLLLSACSNLLQAGPGIDIRGVDEESKEAEEREMGQQRCLRFRNETDSRENSSLVLRGQNPQAKDITITPVGPDGSSVANQNRKQDPLDEELEKVKGMISSAIETRDVNAIAWTEIKKIIKALQEQNKAIISPSSSFWETFLCRSAKILSEEQLIQSEQTRIRLLALELSLPAWEKHTAMLKVTEEAQHCLQSNVSEQAAKTSQLLIRLSQQMQLASKELAAAWQQTRLQFDKKLQQEPTKIQDEVRLLVNTGQSAATERHPLTEVWYQEMLLIKQGEDVARTSQNMFELKEKAETAMVRYEKEREQKALLDVEQVVADLSALSSTIEERLKITPGHLQKGWKKTNEQVKTMNLLYSKWINKVKDDAVFKTKGAGGTVFQR